MYKPNEKQYDKMISPLCHTPPMGWNSWNTFSWNINAELIMSSADKMIETGLAEALDVQERQLKS